MRLDVKEAALFKNIPRGGTFYVEGYECCMKTDQYSELGTNAVCLGDGWLVSVSDDKDVFAIPMKAVLYNEDS